MSRYTDVTQELGVKLKNLRALMPETAKSFHALQKAAIEPGVLDGKTKELIALAISVAARCEGCVAFHAQALARLGATKEEVADAMAVATLMGGGPSMMWAAEAMSAFEEFTEAIKTVGLRKITHA